MPATHIKTFWDIFGALDQGVAKSGRFITGFVLFDDVWQLLWSLLFLVNF